MRVAFVADVHANLHAFGGVLEHLSRAPADLGHELRAGRCACGRAEVAVDTVFHVGDLVGYGAHPTETLHLVRDLGIEGVVGNHDWAALHDDPVPFNPAAFAGLAHARRALDHAGRTYLKELPQRRALRLDSVDVDLVHGSPADPLWEYVFPEEATRVLADFTRTRVAARGDAAARGGATAGGGATARGPPATRRGAVPTAGAELPVRPGAPAGPHAPRSLVPTGEGPRSPRTDRRAALAASGEAAVELTEGGAPSAVLVLGHTHVPITQRASAPGGLATALLNPGSVGQPRDGDPRAAFAVLDTVTGEVEAHRVYYDIQGAARAIRAAGLPGSLAERLFAGR